MKKERTWWVALGEKSSVRMSLTLSCWNPLDELEVRRSFSINRLCSQVSPFMKIVIALICVKMEWYLYIN
jgi:hypothetical protein